MNENFPHFYEFEDFHLDTDKRFLHRDDEIVPLVPKAFDILLLLVKNHGEVVEKETILKSVWRDTFVEENNLNVNISLLRKIFGEKPNEHRFIMTIPGVGYKFVADVREVLVEQAENQPQISNQAKVTEQTTKGDYKQRYILVAMAIAVLLISILAFNRQSETPIKSNAPKSIAVLPVKPVNTDNRDLIYELGIAESLICKLSLVKGLRVRPLSATRKYSDIEQDTLTAGREQQVDYVLASNYQIADGKILVTSQLINVRSGSVEEFFKSEKDTADKFLMQDAVANDIGNPLLARFGSRENNLTAERGTTNEEAYRLYLKATYIFEEWNEPEIGKAIEYLEQSVKLDPNYAEAYIDLAYAYQCYQFIWSKNIPSEREYYPKSKEAIEKALALDENSAEAHAVLGLIKSSYERDFAGAEKEYQRAIELNPDSGMAHGLYAYYLMHAGHFDKALAEQKKAIEINPASVVNHIAYGMVLYNAHRYTEATAHFKKMNEKDENLYHPYQWLWFLSDLQGNEQEAYEWFIKYQTQIKTDPETIRLYQTAYQKSGVKGILREVIRQDEAKVKIDNNPDYLYEIACFNAKLGNKDKAFEYLGKAYERRRSSLNFIKVDPSLDSLHGDPRFDELVRRVGLN